MLFWKHFLVLLWFLHVEYAFIYAVRGQVYFLFHRNIQFTQQQLLKRLFSTQLCSLPCPYMWRSFFYFIMFHLSTYPIQCQYYTLFITVALKWTLISSRPNTLKFFNIFVLFLALSITIINLRICHIPLKICWYLVENSWTFKIAFLLNISHIP